LGTSTISVIIPARNAASTIERTLRSIVDQTFSGWEVVVVDDGSIDQTADVLRRWSQQDKRFSLVQQAQRGVSAARNAGFEASAGRWVLFLDADDVVEPGYFAAVMKMLEADPHLDGVRCRWVNESSSGRRMVNPDPLSEPGATLLSVSMRTCPLAVHACVLARDVVQTIGGFNEALGVGEDWDFWNRLGRRGVHLGALDEAYAVYVLRSGSASRRDFARVHAECVTVLRRAHDAEFDTACAAPTAAGAPLPPSTELEALIRDNLLWAMALAVGAERDLAPLFAAAMPFSRLDLDTAAVAEMIFSHAPLGGGFVPDEWPEHWQALEAHINASVASFATWVGDPNAARPILRRLERSIVGPISGRDSVRIGATLSVPVDIESPIAPIEGLGGVEQVVLRVHHGSIVIGTAEVAVLESALQPNAIEEAIRHQLAGPILRAAWRRPTFLRSFVAPIDVRRAAHEAARLVVDLPGRSGGSRHELFRGFARSVVDSSTRGSTEFEVLAGDTKDHDVSDARHWEALFAEADPWSYTNSYEQLKYEQTLSLLADGTADHALELACAEGHFTSLLAPHVGHLLATDISTTALARAAQRSSDHANVEFRTLDLIADALPSDLDLVVCSEVLYYYDRPSVEALAVRIRNALRPGGVFVSAHANLLTDEPRRTGFDWGHAVTAAVVQEVFAATPGLALEREMSCDLYRIMRFRRVSESMPPRPKPEPERIDYAKPLDPMIARMVVWGGFETTREEAARNEVTDHLPILMYHRISEGGTGHLARYRTSPDAFEAQLAYLRRHGYYGITLRQWWYQLSLRQPLDGRAVLLTFDDGYADFYENAWPLLEGYGFPATVFIVADAVAGQADWDSDLESPSPPLLDWPTIRRLADARIDFGSHCRSHRALTSMRPRQALAQERAARAIFERELGHPVSTMAYPYGAVDEGVRQTMRAAGYRIGVEARSGLATVWDDPMAIPRMEVRGDLGLDHFVTLLGEPNRRSVLRKGLRSVRRRSGR
jgi:peptidoglycan/xylan/chitin deacetylase (PgdA/CDA1 family)/GT2 family glycosyltransferase